MPREVARLETDVRVARQVVHRAGSAVIFTETLAHGTLPWRAPYERRSILYKYSPGALSYSRRYLPDGLADHLDELSPSQRALLEPPYRPGRPRIGELLSEG